MNIIIVASEFENFKKTGGLGDFVDGLASALSKKSINTKVIMPYYNHMSNTKHLKELGEFSIANYGDERFLRYRVFNEDYKGINCYFIDNSYYFNRDEVYGYDDDYLRFAFFDCAVVNLINEMNWDYDVLHLNDWHTGLIPLLVKDNKKIVLTIHNHEYQGEYQILNKKLMETYLNQPVVDDKINFLKTEVENVNTLTTVSPSYASQLMANKGFNTDNALIFKDKKITGILNGINPINYLDSMSFKSFKEHKMKTKLEIQERFNLEIDSEIPLLVSIGRLDEQKGVDLLIENLNKITGEAQLILLGTGKPYYEEALKNFEKESNNFIANICFNKSLADSLYLAGDIFLMPSDYEPCGIGQLIAMDNGTVPVVYNTGGLKDSIINYKKDNGNGFKFYEKSPQSFLKAINTAISVFKEDSLKWDLLMKNGMENNYTWDKQADKYIDLYKQVK